MYTVVSVIVMYIMLHMAFLTVRVALRLAFPLLSEKSLKEVILDSELHKYIFKFIMFIYVGLLGISLFIVAFKGL